MRRVMQVYAVTKAALVNLTVSLSKELAMEYAVELNRLVKMEMEGSVG